MPYTGDSTIVSCARDGKVRGKLRLLNTERVNLRFN